MSPHVLVRAEKHEEQQERVDTLPASLFFCFFCISIFTFVSLLVTYLDKYKQQIVRRLLRPFGGLGEEEEDDDDEFHHLLLNHRNLHQFNQLNQSHQSHYNHHGYNRQFVMPGPKVELDSNERVLFHVQVTMGCNGLRDLYNLGYMRQDTLEKRIDGAINRLSVPSVVSICAIWLRERICRTYSTGMSPSVRDLCVFLERRGSSRNMCCQIFYDAFQKCLRDQVKQVSLRVGNRTLTNFRDVVDHVFDNWYQWVEAAATPATAQPAQEEENVAAKDPAPLPYPAHNHDLAAMSSAAYSSHFNRSLKKLHKHQNHHYYQDRVVGATPASHEGRHSGDAAPFDLGQASSWGSDAGQSGRCNTRLDDCVCRRCNIRGWLSLLPITPAAPPVDTLLVLSPSTSSSNELDLTADAAGHHVRDCSAIISSPSGPEDARNKCAAREKHSVADCPVKGGHVQPMSFVSKEDTQMLEAHDKMYMNPQRAALLAETLQAENRAVTATAAVSAAIKTGGKAAIQRAGQPQVVTTQPPQVLSSHMEADNESSSDLILFSSSPNVEEVESARLKDDASKALDNSPTFNRGRRAEGRFFGNDDDHGVAEVDSFLAGVDVSLEERAQVIARIVGSGMTSQVQGESCKELNMDVEPPLLDNAPDTGNGEASMPGPVLDCQQMQGESDIQSGVQPGISNNPRRILLNFEDVFYLNEDNVWVRKAHRPTALDMWDSSTDDDRLSESNNWQ
ncbi:hypothetical protein TARUN_3460 [Trichoderma arundinaceum]|uniref:Uncharacterized protein n=1 Tax=Trichoderma arundinaceum TaxID=490622 RepID=A0A395NS39_TRIAR|nr:hypothetical protein TARUN_3460 [Trichoderma arundinaceum]